MGTAVDHKMFSALARAAGPAIRAQPLASRFNLCTAARLTGTVKWYNPVKGYGFIVQDDDGSDIFCHQTSIEMDGFRQLYEGDVVEYETQETERGPQTSSVYVKVSNAPAHGSSPGDE